MMITPLILALLPALQSTELISSDSNGVSSNGHSAWAHSSANGELVVFDSLGNNLALNDLNSETDVFLKNRISGEITLISAAPNGFSGNARSALPNISKDGRIIVFLTDATDLVPGGNPAGHSILFDKALGTLEVVSRNSSQEIANVFTSPISMSPDGRFLLLFSRATNLDPRDAGCTSCNPENLFIRDLIQKTTKRVTVGINGEWMNSPPYFPLRGRSISGDGRFVVISTKATNLEPGYGNNRRHVYLIDTWNETTTLVSSSASGGHANGDSQWASISLDGRYVAFESNATDLLPGGTWQATFSDGTE
jgi:hypothetical protein